MWAIFRRFLRRIDELHEGDHGDESLAEPAEVPEVAVVQPVLAVDEDGWLMSPDGIVKVQRFPTVRIQNLGTPKVRGILWHWTATGENTIINIAKRMMTYVRGKDRAASFHLGIPRLAAQGVVQCASLDRGTWHAGGATAKRFTSSGDISASGIYSANAVLAGVELENVGEVRPGIDGTWRGWPFEDEKTKKPKGPVVPADQVVPYGGRFYQNFTEHQYEMAEEVIRAMVEAYGCEREHFELGHVDVDPKRKSDPGPIWRHELLTRILPAVFG